MVKYSNFSMLCLNCFHKSPTINFYCVHRHNSLFNGKKFSWSWRLVCASGYGMWPLISTLNKNTLVTTYTHTHIHIHMPTCKSIYSFSLSHTQSSIHKLTHSLSHIHKHIHIPIYLCSYLICIVNFSIWFGTWKTFLHLFSLKMTGKPVEIELPFNLDVNKQNNLCI